METKQLNGYKIEFYSEEEWNEELPIYRTKGIQIICESDENTFEYAGLVSEINEDLAEKIVDKHQYNKLDRFGNILVMYKDYGFEKVNNEELFDIDFAKQSFQTLSNLEYCVITKME